MDIRLAKNGCIELGDFNAVQAYKIACKLEREGMDFYQEVLKQKEKTPLANAVRYLLETEKDHLQFFENKLDAASRDGDDAFEEDDIVNALDTHIFCSHEFEEIQDKKRTEEMVGMGLKMEARSISFYSALLSQTQDPEARKALGVIIDEERKHYNTLKQFI